MSLKFRINDYLTEHIKRCGAYSKAVQEADLQYDCASLTYVDQSNTIGKEDLREMGANSQLKLFWRRASSSGTSGQPFLFPQPIASLQREQGFIDKIWRSVGFHKNSKVAVVRGTLVPNLVQQSTNRLIISCQGWSDNDIAEKLSALHRFKPDFIHCYPSLLERLIRRAVAMGLTFPTEINAVFSGSEECTSEHVKLFSGALRCDTVAWYGQSEQVVLAVREADGSYAVVPGYSDVAFVQVDDALEIVGKSKSNPFFSNAWYRTGDYCSSAETRWSEALRCTTIIMSGLQGRSPKLVSLSDGSCIPFNHIVFGLHSRNWSAIDRYCFVQDQPGVLLFIYAKAAGVIENDVARLVDELTLRLPEKLILKAVGMPELSYSTRPKWSYFFHSRNELDRFLMS